VSGALNEPLRSYGIVGRPLTKLVTYYRLVHGVRLSLADLPNSVGRIVAECRAVAELCERHAGLRLEGLRGLEIGAGQLPRQMIYFARKNRMTGIDLDYIAQDFDLAMYWDMLRRNGPGRVFKTAGRKLLGFDRLLLRELCRQLGCGAPPPFERMRFPDASFDFVYSIDVFEHLAEPGRVLDEIIRVLRPGGAVIVSLLSYTAEAGPHDLRTHGGPRGGLPYWAHLRPRFRDRVQPSVYVNGLSTADWKQLVADKMPGAAWERSRARNHEELVAALRELRASGELDGHDDEDLLGYRLRFCWRKPA
jgi:SAM-dependent methyltransferase